MKQLLTTYKAVCTLNNMCAESRRDAFLSRRRRARGINDGEGGKDEGPAGAAAAGTAAPTTTGATAAASLATRTERVHARRLQAERAVRKTRAAWGRSGRPTRRATLRQRGGAHTHRLWRGPPRN